jgi:hypothetical protein
MRNSFILLMILLVTPAIAFSQSAYSSGTQDNQSQTIQQQDNGTTTLTGCLSGKTGEYQLVDQSGDKHLILSAGIDLSSYLGHSVEVTGKYDIRRDASASSDEATAHGMHFFKVTAMDKDLGACK